MDTRFYRDGFWIIWSSQIMTTDERKFLRRSEARR
jgi:hypothetical protein